MKISYMMLREDFDKINRETLNLFYDASDKVTDLFIYPQLNAIVTRKPSKAVKQYLYTEYSVTGSLLKRMAVWCYTRILMNSWGILASKKLKQKGDIGTDILIYPCNKKYRVFDFAADQVSVITKSGFPVLAIQHEIAFRKEHHAAFMLPLLDCGENYYSETIIHGKPLARVKEGRKEYTDEAYRLWKEYVSSYRQEMKAETFAHKMMDRSEEVLETLSEALGEETTNELKHLMKVLCKRISQYDTMIPLTLSHGDIQPGNIWVEDRTQKIYIIDWESVEMRSSWYDEELLFGGLRMVGGLKKISESKPSVRKYVLMSEELMYRLEDICYLPFEIRRKTTDDIKRDFNVQNIG